MDNPETETLSLTRAELNAALAEAAQKGATSAVEAIRNEALLKGAPGEEGEDFAGRLAMAIAELSDQGTRRVRVSPEVAAQRQKGRDRMVRLINEARQRVIELGLDRDLEAAQAQGLVPEYKVRVKIYLDERLIEPFTVGRDKIARPTEIFWFGIPNEGMIPSNDLAKSIYAEYRTWLGGERQQVKGEDLRPMSVTAGGLTVKGEISRRKVVGSLDASFVEDTVTAPALDGLLSIRSPVDPNAREVNILGTVASPAKQNFEGASSG